MAEPQRIQLQRAGSASWRGGEPGLMRITMDHPCRACGSKEFYMNGETGRRWCISCHQRTNNVRKPRGPQLRERRVRIEEGAPEKWCPKCCTWWPLNDICWHQATQNPDGWRNECKACRTEKRRERVANGGSW